MKVYRFSRQLTCTIIEYILDSKEYSYDATSYGDDFTKLRKLVKEVENNESGLFLTPQLRNEFIVKMNIFNDYLTHKIRTR